MAADQVLLQDDKERFFRRYTEADAETVCNFYMFDRQNGNSITQSVWMARENARSLRHLVSTELWSHLNVFYNRLNDLSVRPVTASNLSRLCETIKEDCQLHTGIVEGTLHRDQSWFFYRIGKLLERADQTTRLVDIKYHNLLPRLEDVGTPVDVSQWNAVLHSAAAYHAFRRVNPRGMSPNSIASFLLFNDRFPRSVRVCVREIRSLLVRLRDDEGLAAVDSAIRMIDAIRAATEPLTIEQVIQMGLHEFNEGLQRHLIKLTNEFGRTFFGGESYH